MKKKDSLLIKKFLSYVVVGGLATVVEWVCYWLFQNLLFVPYILATIGAFVISTFSNWFFGRLLTFRNAPKRNVLSELFQIYLASVVGLVLNILIMWLLHNRIEDMLSKVIATGVVFIYNYLIRTLIIYSKQPPGNPPVF